MPLPIPTIKIRITGLLVFYFKQGPAAPPPSGPTECQIGVMPPGEKELHGLRINVHKLESIEQGVADSNAVLELFRQVRDPKNDITLRVENPDVEGIVLFPQTSGPFGPLPPGSQESPFDLIPDIEGGKLHGGAVKIKPGQLKQIIRLNNGVFYTLRSRQGWTIREQGGVSRFEEVGIDAGVNIYLKDARDSKAVLTYGPRPDQWIELKKEPNTAYKIEILNDRLGPVEDHDDASLHENDFKQYYNALDVAPNEQFSMIFPPLPPPRLDKAHPCGIIKGMITQGIKT